LLLPVDRNHCNLRVGEFLEIGKSVGRGAAIAAGAIEPIDFNLISTDYLS